MSLNSLCDFKENNYVVPSGFVRTSSSILLSCVCTAPVDPACGVVRLNELYWVSQSSTTL